MLLVCYYTRTGGMDPSSPHRCPLGFDLADTVNVVVGIVLVLGHKLAVLFSHVLVDLLPVSVGNRILLRDVEDERVLSHRSQDLSDRLALHPECTLDLVEQLVRPV